MSIPHPTKEQILETAETSPEDNADGYQVLIPDIT